jgi:hypothetical protein
MSAECCQCVRRKIGRVVIHDAIQRRHSEKKYDIQIDDEPIKMALMANDQMLVEWSITSWVIPS